MMSDFIYPNWPAPSHVHAVCTLRKPGLSQPPYDAFNLALHVDDHPSHVLANRKQLCEVLKLQQEPAWLTQTHSTTCVVIEETTQRDADAAITRTSKHCLAIMTADCLPILLCDKKGREIAAIHAGWKGLAHGIIEQTLSKMHTPATDLLAWLGPAICGKCYEVGEEIYHIFAKRQWVDSKTFRPYQQKWLANIPAIATQILKKLNVQAIYSSELCTFENPAHFYSYRRDGITGRIATLCWMD